MKKVTLVVVFALVLTVAFASSAFATTGKYRAGGVDYYTWSTPTSVTPMGRPYIGASVAGTSGLVSAVPTGVVGIGANATNPGAHANYLATTAKCGMCHSVHRAVAGGTKLLPTADATCAGCHTGSTAITAKLITWTAAPSSWIPTISPTDPLYPIGGAEWMAASDSERYDAITNKTDAGGANNQGGPHNDSAATLIEDGYWDGVGAAPEPGYEIGHRYGCFTRRCHATNPHGAGGSQYKLLAAKLLFNTSANADQEGDGTYGGLDAEFDNLGATDAAVVRFVKANASIIQTTAAGDLLINKNGTGFRAPDEAETHALVAGLTCGRPSNPSTGEDECHAESSYAIFDKAVQENRNAATGINTVKNPVTGGTSSGYRTDNTGAEVAGFGGNDSRTAKTGHVAGTFAAVPGSASYAPIAGCTSCHDQTDAANTVKGNFTFPHGQTPSGATNLADNVGGSGTPHRARIWMGYGAYAGAPLTSIGSGPEKAYDGNCLKCHRDSTNALGIGLTK